MEKNDRSRIRIGQVKKRALIYFSIAVIGAALVAFLLVTTIERKSEGQNPFYRVVELNDETEDPELWGKNFPLQYDSYRKTVDQVRTRYGGSEAVPRTPSQADPRSFVSQSRLEEDPRLKKIWEGYAFSKDFREERGHAFMLLDQEYTERQQATKQPGTCLHCHASIYLPYKTAGNGDLIKGFEILNQLPYFEARKQVRHPIACIDCHDPKTMALRVTRPAFLEGISRVKSLEGHKRYDVNRDATRQEMRTYVCAQCHDEYYFKGKEKRLVYPWHMGLKVEKIYTYYQEQGHKDWEHPKTGAAMLKAQHPEFELWSQGIHARSGVTCADCHMPYTRQGAMKISDHHVRSPVLNINRACQTCHHWNEVELKNRIEEIQSTTFSLRNKAMDAIVELIQDLEKVRSLKSQPRGMLKAQGYHRQAQFYLDFVEAENSTGFHAPQEAARILAESIDYARRGQNALRD